MTHLELWRTSLFLAFFLVFFVAKYKNCKTVRLSQTDNITNPHRYFNLATILLPNVYFLI